MDEVDQLLSGLRAGTESLAPPPALIDDLRRAADGVHVGSRNGASHLPGAARVAAGSHLPSGWLMATAIFGLLGAGVVAAVSISGPRFVAPTVTPPVPSQVAVTSPVAQRVQVEDGIHAETSASIPASHRPRAVARLVAGPRQRSSGDSSEPSAPPAAAVAVVAPPSEPWTGPRRVQLLSEYEGWLPWERTVWLAPDEALTLKGPPLLSGAAAEPADGPSRVIRKVVTDEVEP